MIEIPLVVLGTIGSCCSNVVSFEMLHEGSKECNTIITLSQTIFIVFVIMLYKKMTDSRIKCELKSSSHLLPIILQNFSGYLGNLVFQYNVSMPIHIVLRSLSIVFTMTIGYFSFHKRYSRLQIIGSILIGFGTVIFTMDKNSFKMDKDMSNSLTGVSILLFATLLTSFNSLYKEHLFKDQRNSSWIDNMYLNSIYGLIIFLPLVPKLKSEFVNINDINLSILFWNCLTQLICVLFVNILSVKVSGLSVVIILLVRKVISLGISIIVFSDTSLSTNELLGIVLVFFGGFIYSFKANNKSKEKVS